MQIGLVWWNSVKKISDSFARR